MKLLDKNWKGTYTPAPTILPSFLVINELNGEITRYENQLNFYKTEYEKNDRFFRKLMNNKQEKEKYARENYFMKKPNEEIFILVVDSSKIAKK